MQQNKGITSDFFKNETFKRATRMLFSAVVWLAIWQILYMVIENDILFASPATVFSRLWMLIGTKAFWLKTAHSLWGITKGYLLGVIFGTMLAVLTASSKLLYAVFQPMLSVIKATPVVSFIILALVWMQKNTVPVFISFLMVLPVVWANLSVGIRETDEKLLEVAKAYKFGIGKTIRHIYLPSVMPVFLTALTTATGFAWKAGIAAEVISTPRHAIGSELYNAKVYLETADLFAWTLVVILLSMIFEKLIIYTVSKISKRVAKEK